jgi:hypothetical protein
MSIARYKLIRKKPLTVERTLPGAFVNGRWLEGELSTLEIKGHYYPLTANEKSTLPESFRSKSTLKLHSVTELYSVREKDSQSSDKVLIKDNWFEVQEADPFFMGIQYHYEYLLVRIEQSAGGVS